MTGTRRCVARVEVHYVEEDAGGGEYPVKDDGYVPEDGGYLCADSTKARLYKGPMAAMEGAQEFVRDRMLGLYRSGIWRIVIDAEAY